MRFCSRKCVFSLLLELHDLYIYTYIYIYIYIHTYVYRCTYVFTRAVPVLKPYVPDFSASEAAFEVASPGAEITWA